MDCAAVEKKIKIKWIEKESRNKQVAAEKVNVPSYFVWWQKGIQTDSIWHFRTICELFLKQQKCLLEFGCALQRNKNSSSKELKLVVPFTWMDCVGAHSRRCNKRRFLFMRSLTTKHCLLFDCETLFIFSIDVLFFVWREKIAINTQKNGYATVFFRCHWKNKEPHEQTLQKYNCALTAGRSRKSILMFPREQTAVSLRSCHSNYSHSNIILNNYKINSGLRIVLASGISNVKQTNSLRCYGTNFDCCIRPASCVWLDGGSIFSLFTVYFLLSNVHSCSTIKLQIKFHRDKKRRKNTA